MYLFLYLYSYIYIYMYIYIYSFIHYILLQVCIFFHGIYLTVLKPLHGRTWMACLGFSCNSWAMAGWAVSEPGPDCQGNSGDHPPRWCLIGFHPLDAPTSQITSRAVHPKSLLAPFATNDPTPGASDGAPGVWREIPREKTHFYHGPPAIPQPHLDAMDLSISRALTSWSMDDPWDLFWVTTHKKKRTVGIAIPGPSHLQATFQEVWLRRGSEAAREAAIHQTCPALRAPKTEKNTGTSSINGGFMWLKTRLTKNIRHNPRTKWRFIKAGETHIIYIYRDYPLVI